MNTYNDIECLINDYQNKTIDAFTLQKSIYEYYKVSDQSEIVKQVICDVIERTEELQLRDDMWLVFFKTDRVFAQEIDLLQNRIQALSYLKDIEENKSSSKIFIKHAAQMAYLLCSHGENNGYNLKKERIWINLFSSIPEFSTFLQQEKQHKLDLEQENKEKYKEYFDDIKSFEDKPVVASYTIHCPIKWNTIIDLSEPGIQILLQEIIHHFNSFGLQGYMDVLKDKCNHSSLLFDGGFTFQFDCCEKLSNEELIKAKDALQGQLSNGWGSNMSQNIILIGADEISFDFDYQNISSMQDKKQYSRNKIK